MEIQDLLLICGGVSLLAAAICWLSVLKRRIRPDGRPTLSLKALRKAAAVTAASFFVLGIGVIWSAVTSLRGL